MFLGWGPIGEGRLAECKGCLHFKAWCGMHIALGGGFPWHGKILQHYLKLVCVQRKNNCPSVPCAGSTGPHVNSNLSTKSICQELQHGFYTLGVCEYSEHLNIEANNTMFDMKFFEALKWAVVSILGYMKLCLVENKKCTAKTQSKYIVCIRARTSWARDALYFERLRSAVANMHQFSPLGAMGFPATHW